MKHDELKQLIKDTMALRLKYAENQSKAQSPIESGQYLLILNRFAVVLDNLYEIEDDLYYNQ